MGILRADRITGLGGANAIKGSVKFASGGALDIDLDGTSIGTSNFTIEAWVFWFGNGFHQFTGSSSNNFNFYIADDDGDLKFYDGSNTYDLDASPIRANEWTHVALVREGTSTSQTKVYVNGVNTQSVTINTDFSFNRLLSGINYLDGSRGYGNGYTSNLRFTLDTVYTSAFTPPNHELTILDNTIVLCCQSPGNVLQEATGKTVVVFKHGVNQGDPVASHFTPNSPIVGTTSGFSTTTDVGGQYGSTFDGFGNFATSTYMVPPGGNTAERNRGRALFGGGSTIDNTIQSLNIQSQGNTENFGDLSTGRYETECASSSTRGIWGGGYTESPNVKVDVIEFVTIANSSNTTDFGNLTVARGHLAGMCNSTRGVFANGSTDPGPNVNTLDYITIATAGNAIDFGDSTTASKPMGGGRSSTTRGIFTLGNAPSAVNTIEYITIATTANSQDFGDLTGFSGWGKGAGNISSGTRAILGGGHEALNNIEYITIASLGNGTDFGDLIGGRRSAFTAGSKIRGVIGGGKNPSQLNNIEFITIASAGNGVAFGEMINSKSFASGLSDCHGGLSE